ncbi:hypothetical protein C2E23DRAFT_739585 [Lenzites betulinus]|nr:hypothetical protein C2E23DRAFT_739585 [Lenzites betulinus]
MALTPPPFDPANIQGDIVAGLAKKAQHFVFFQIDDNVDAFRRSLAMLIPIITTTPQALVQRQKIALMKTAAKQRGTPVQTLTLAAVNIAFSQAGLGKLGITEDIGDTVFQQGQLSDAGNLGDSGAATGNGSFDPDQWLPAFKETIHGVILIAGDSDATVTATRQQIETIFSSGQQAGLHEILTLTGSVRPGALHAHEHFGFLDSISQPAVAGIDVKPNPGQEAVRQGIILCGRDGDLSSDSRPSWAVDGSFMAFRYLAQLVPEFDTFLKNNPIQAIGLTPEQGSELLGARLVGRWKSGKFLPHSFADTDRAPIDLTPLQDNPAWGTDPTKNDNFQYDPNSEERCPFAAHTRKTNPRSDLDPEFTERHRILRRGIQFGPEVTTAEADSGTSDPANARGLLFVCYQSALADGFQFIQQSWANAIDFPDKPGVLPGFDAIIGQTNEDGVRTINGVDPNNPGGTLSLPMQWVVPKGGEYFFSPSIQALRTRFSLTT